MRHHHVCFVVTDMDKAIRLWRDVLGFTVKVEMETPDGEEPGPNVYVPRPLLETIFGCKGAHTKCTLQASPEGARIELLQPLTPKVERLPAEMIGYGKASIQEAAFEVDDIDAVFRKVRAAGYETQTDYVWDCGDIGRSFLFYDDDRSLIQLWQTTSDREAW